MRLLAIVLSTLLMAGCTGIDSLPAQRIASAALSSASNLPAGTAVVIATVNKVSLNIAAAGLSEGSHAVHLHSVGACEAAGFTSAGPHLNPGARQHGTANPAGSHLGDLPNLTIGANGGGALTTELRGNRAEIEAALFDADGTAVVIHAGPDDDRTDPSGNSGARVACGVLKRY